MRNILLQSILSLVVAVGATAQTMVETPNERTGPWDQRIVDAFAAMPVQHEGRIKPFDTLVQFTLYPIHQKRKVHLPDEPGFHEVDHYRPGTEPPRRVDLEGLALGVQLCSDANRPVGSHLLAAQGVQAIVVPRATEQSQHRFIVAFAMRAHRLARRNTCRGSVGSWLR